MDNSQALAGLAICALPCAAVFMAFAAGVVIGRRGVPRLTWDRSGTGKPTTTTLLKSRQTVRNAEELQES